MFENRWYQEESVDACFNDLIEKQDCHPLIVAPTGTGKTAIMSKLIDRILSHDVLSNILILSHDKRILEQNHESLENYFEGIEIGLYSTGLNRKEINKITVAGIQSMYRKIKPFSHFNYVIIDEAHKINNEEKGMYRKFLDKIEARYIGLTATHFRTGQGYLHTGENALFNHISYDMSSPEIFNRIIDEGFLCPLYSKNTALKLNVEELKKRVAGDFSDKEMSEKFDRESITQAAIIESTYYGKKYKHWLCFAIDINHCDNITRMLCEAGVPAVSIHSAAEDVDKKIEDYKKGVYKCAVNVNMLTTGFDFPAIDFIIDLRPTQSPIIHIQGKGRGLRPLYKSSPFGCSNEERKQLLDDGPKPHCLVLDFAGNTKRLGPINHVMIRDKTKSKDGKGEAVTKVCPDCDFINHGAAKNCVNCNHEFKFLEKLTLEASTADIIERNDKKENKMKKAEKQWLDVSSVSYELKNRYNKPNCVLVKYRCGMRNFKDFVFLDDKGYALYKAKHWVAFRWNSKNKKPISSLELVQNSRMLKTPIQILVDPLDRYNKALDYRF
jgi:DNA repair protein RadD